MAYAADSIGWARAAQLFGASFFRQSANPSGVVKMKRALSPEGLAELRSDFNKLYGGPSGANKVVFLDVEMDYQAISVEPEKGQFIETNQFLLDEVCRWFGVPPHKIYNLLRATFSNIEHQSIEVEEDSIEPWAIRFQDEADYKLLGQNRRSLYSQIELRELAMADMKTRMEYNQGMRNMGAMNVNEIRRREGLNGIGPDGEKYTMQSGMTTLDKIGEDPEPEPAPAPPLEKEDPEEAAAVNRMIGRLEMRLGNAAAGAESRVLAAQDTA
jgi:HK97 family phage portal protein